MHSHLTMQERDVIAKMRAQGASQSAIARALGRSPSTISRELRRNGTPGGYGAAQAHQAAQERRRQRTRKRKMDDEQIRERVLKGLTQYWSPEQIAGRMRLEGHDPKARVCAKTIYTWIATDPDREHWRSFLRRRGKRPRRRQRESVGAPVQDRPEVVERRERLGDFEGDTILGRPGCGGLVTLVDRKSGYTLLAKIQTKHAEHVYAKIRRLVRQLPAGQRHSLTIDNGSEFARCGRLKRSYNMDVYTCRPGRPQERATNENTNGLIRQFLPKGCDFREVSRQKLQYIERLLNDRPRARLGYRTPAEVFFGKTQQLLCV